MKRRMTMATAVVGIALSGLSGCGPRETSEGAGPTPSSTITTTATPSAEPTPTDAVGVIGDWHDTKAKWVVHFHKDGTFVEDFEGLVDFRVGTYAVDGTVVSLIGDDGNTDKGTIEGGTLVFNLGTLTRM